MKNIQKLFIGSLFALSATMPALANYSQFDVKGTIDNSISVQVYDSGDNLFSDNDNDTNIPVINFGKINTLGKKPATADIGAGIGNAPVNTFLSYSRLQTLLSADMLAPGDDIAGGLFAITAPGGAIKVQVDSTASTNANLSVDYTTIAGTPPDLVLAANTVPLNQGSALNSDVNAHTVVIPAGYLSIPIAGTGGYISSQPMVNGGSNPIPNRLGMNIGLLALKPYDVNGSQVSLTNGAFTGRVKFIATAL